jgi:hypothetical protein
MPYQYQSYVNVSGLWKSVSHVYVKVGSSWQEMDRGYINNLGTYRLVQVPEFTITSSIVLVGSGSGTISPLGATIKLSHENLTLTITPTISQYDVSIGQQYDYLSNMVIDGIVTAPPLITPSTKAYYYTFSNLQNNRTIEVTFSRKAKI